MEKLVSTNAFEFTSVQVPESIQESLKSKAVISIASYNILADCFITPSMKRAINEKWLDFAHRSAIIFDEIKELNADVVLLQELDHFPDYYSEKFDSIGYGSIVQGRKTMPDSVAILYKKDKIKLLAHKEFDFDKGHDYESDEVFHKDNVGICADFELVEAGKKFTVFGAHLYYNPKEDHVKYLQGCLMKAYLEENYKESDAVFWGGDLNTRPSNNLLYYVLDGEKPLKKRIDNTKDPILLETQTKTFEKYSKIKTDIKWENLYRLYGECLGEKAGYPKYTNYTYKFKGVLDHILYNKNAVIPLKMLKIQYERINKEETLPCETIASDHLPIMGFFAI